LPEEGESVLADCHAGLPVFRGRRIIIMPRELVIRELQPQMQ
jgi:hypothetical protein